MGRGRRGTGPGMGKFASLLLLKHSFPVPCFVLEDSGFLKGRF